MKTQKKNILITGGTGYIGSAFIPVFSPDFTVLLYDRNAPKDPLPDGTIFFRGDIRNKNELETTMKTHQPFCVIHLAADIRAGASEQAEKEIYETNVLGTENVLSAMRECSCRHILFASSAAVYGNANSPLHESSSTSPLGSYGRSKKEAEQRILKSPDIISGIFRLFNVSGLSDGQIHASLFRDRNTLITNAFRAAAENRELFLYGNKFPTLDKTAIRDYVHVHDVGNAFKNGARFLFRQKESFIVNIGSGIGTSNKEVITLISALTGKTIRCVPLPARKQEIAISIADNQVAKKILDWHPQQSTIQEILTSLLPFYA